MKYSMFHQIVMLDDVLHWQQILNLFFLLSLQEKMKVNTVDTALH